LSILVVAVSASVALGAGITGLHFDVEPKHYGSWESNYLGMLAKIKPVRLAFCSPFACDEWSGWNRVEKGLGAQCVKEARL
jgi:hypothetical protein